MPGHAADRNLLFGILALQMDLISRDALIAAMGAWALAKDRPIGEILVEAGALDAVDRAGLEPMIDRRIAREGGDPARSLATLSNATSLASDLRRSIADPDVLGSLTYVTRYEPPGPDDTLEADTHRQAPPGVRYRKVRDHAKGGLGVVFVAHDEELNRDVALKEIQDRHADNPASRARFLLEAEITGGLEHPGIVPVYGLGSYDDGRPFYAMRFIRGESLKEAIAAFHVDEKLEQDPGERALRLQKLLRRFLDVCNAVAYAHSRGVLHRDLKPDNVMVGKYGETLVVDWGLAKAGGRAGGDIDASGLEATLNPASASGSAETLPGSVVGTPAYMSPEQAEGRIEALGPSSDVYSLGATLYALLTGVAPFSGKPLGEIMADVRAGRFARPREVVRWLDPALEAVCLRAMALRSDARYPSPKALAGDIESWLADEPVSAWREPWSRRARRWAGRHRVAIQAGSALVVASAALGFAALAVHRSNRINEIRREISAGLEVDEWSPAHLEAMEARGRELGRLDPVEGAEVRHESHQRYARALGETINRPETLATADLERLDGGLRLLEARAPDLALPLRKNLALRLSRWSPLFDLAIPVPGDALAKVFPPDRAEVAGNGRIARAPSAGGSVVKTLVGGSGRVRLTATFGEPWDSASAVGLAHDFGPKGRYLFLVSVPEFAPKDLEGPEKVTSMASVRSGPGRLSVTILRDRSILGRATIPIPVGPLRMEAEHDGEILSLQVNGQAPLVSEDPFPILVESGPLGVYWPAGVLLNRLTAERLAMPTRPSTMERGDELYRNGRFAEALSFYREQGLARPAGETGRQARFKQALCLIEDGKTDEAAALLREVAEGLEVASSSGRAAPPWSLRAACRLWLLENRRGNFDEADELVARLAPAYRFEQLVTLIPAEDRRAILETYRGAGAWWRVLWLTNPGDLKRARLAVSAQRLLDDDNPRDGRMGLWRIIDIQRSLGDQEAAAKGLGDLLADPDLPPDERVAFARDHAWISITRGEAAIRKALQDVDGWLSKPSRSPDLEPLLLERSRLNAALGEWDRARRDCEEFFQAAGLERLDYAVFADACILRGFLKEQQGDQPGSVEAWKVGLLRRRPGALAAPTRGPLLTGIAMRNRADAAAFAGILASLTGDITEAEASALLEALATGTGLDKLEGTKTPGSIVPFIGKIGVSPAYLRSIVLGEFTDDRGRELARDIAFRRIGFVEYNTGAIKQIVASAIRLNEPDRPIPPAVEEKIWEFSDGLVEAYRQQALKDPQIMGILQLWFRWAFNPPLLAKQMIPQLPAPMRDTAPYVLARRYVTLKRPPETAAFYRMVMDQTKADSMLHQLARRELDAMRP